MSMFKSVWVVHKAINKFLTPSAVVTTYCLSIPHLLPSPKSVTNIITGILVADLRSKVVKHWRMMSPMQASTTSPEILSPPQRSECGDNSSANVAVLHEAHINDNTNIISS